MPEDLASNMGFIMGNKHRERVVQVLGSKGKLSAEKVARFEHIPAPSVKKILADMAERSLVFENDGFVAFAPWAPRSPFETWIVPKRHESNFEAEPKEWLALCAQALRDVLRRLRWAGLPWRFGFESHRGRHIFRPECALSRH